MNDFLVQYYTTPHAETGKTPSEMMYNRTIRSKIPSLNDLATGPPNEDFADRDKHLKTKGKEVTDQARHARKSSIDIGDTVLAAKTGPLTKLDTPFQQVEYSVIDRVGSKATIRDLNSGATFERNVAHLKPVSPREILTPSISTANSEDPTPEVSTLNTVTRPSRTIRKPARLDDCVLAGRLMEDQPL